MVARVIKRLVLENGVVPFDAWLDSLGDGRMQAAVDSRLARMEAGNLGDHKSVGGGVFESRISLGPGLRIYFAQQGRDVIILIGGGDKSTQPRDIRKAQELWRSYLCQ